MAEITTEQTNQLELVARATNAVQESVEALAVINATATK